MSKTPSRTKGDLGGRLLVAAVGVPIILTLAFMAPNWCLWVFYTLAASIGAWEWCAMSTGGHRKTAAACATWTAVGMSAAYWASPSEFYVVTALGALACAAIAVWSGPVESTATRLNALLCGGAYCGILFGALLAMAAGTEAERFVVAEGQATWVLLPMLVIWAGDTGAYFCGRAWGRRPLSRLSPKKTWEGAIGGAVASVGGGFLALLLDPDLQWWHVVVIALPASFLGQVGDLIESALKRSVQVKDSGRVLGQHGGMLDRVDAMVFAAPYFLLMKGILHL